MMTGPPGEPEAPLRPIDHSEDQTLLSSERTYAGWLRTAFAAIAVGLGFAAFFRTGETGAAAKAMATAFLLLAIGILVSADRRAAAVRRRLDPHIVAGASPASLHLITWFAVAATVGLIALIWRLG